MDRSVKTFVFCCVYYSTVLVNSDAWDDGSIYYGWRALNSENVAFALHKADCLHGCMAMSAACSAVYFDDISRQCHRLVFPIVVMENGTESDVTIATRKLEVVYAMEDLESYNYDYSWASLVCQDLHGHLMTKAELTVLWQSGIRLDGCGWIDDSTIWALGYFMMQCTDLAVADAWCKIAP